MAHFPCCHVILSYFLSVRWAFPSKTWKRCAAWVHPPRDWGRQVTKAWASKPASYSQHDHMSCLRITSFSLMRRECEMNAEGICEVMSDMNRIFVRNCPEPLIRRTIAHCRRWLVCTFKESRDTHEIDSCY